MANAAIDIEPFTPNPQTFEIEQQAHGVPWSLAMFLSCQGSHYRNRAAKVDGKVVGYTICQHVADEISLLNIAVHPSFQRQGVASALLTDVLAEVPVQAASVWLEVRASNVPAIALYQRMGFQQVGVRTGYYRRGDTKEDALIYQFTTKV